MSLVQRFSSQISHKLKKISTKKCQSSFSPLVPRDTSHAAVFPESEWPTRHQNPIQNTGYRRSPRHPGQAQTTSFNLGRTSSSQNLAYSRVSPEFFENSTTATPSATSNTSAVMANFPILPSSLLSILNLKPPLSSLATPKPSPIPAPSNASTIAAGDCRDVKIVPFFLLLPSPSNIPDKSKPPAMAEINSNAL
ncbi:hypothetical protein IEQ34_011949 [Dendrobium chrysotoxum]|uniref:Uncharacterized protein n=1 Tax=Dendrobium chrysotoxum TaxID=161865 RepID=A0AAV7GBK6_DENCH|nr:hypothetical protein IEQ34_011949 [Dendrobium chrysotoxum]